MKTPNKDYKEEVIRLFLSLENNSINEIVKRVPITKYVANRIINNYLKSLENKTNNQ